MIPIASLPMYDLPEVRHATDSWWQSIRRHLKAVGIAESPASLTPETPNDRVWRSPDLLLTQTCGYPLTHAYSDCLSAIAVPDYAAPGCGMGRYRSAFVVRGDDPSTRLEDYRGRTAAANGPDSQSGCNVLRAAVAPLAEAGHFFARVNWTGSHRASIAAVRDGSAAIAAIDGVTLALLNRYASVETDGLRILGWSAEAPALPYATRKALSADDRQRLRDALMAAAVDPDADAAREALLIAGMSAVSDDAYNAIPAMRRTAETLGYPNLA